MTRRGVLLLALLGAPGCAIDTAGLANDSVDASLPDAPFEDAAATGDDAPDAAGDGAMLVDADTNDAALDVADTSDALDAVDANDADASDATDASDAPGAADVSDAADALPPCADGLLDGDESDVDCGGHCDKCLNGARCNVGSDCATGYCSSGSCAPDPCANGLLDPGEAGVDCGTVCNQPCGAGSHCFVAADCTTGLCASNACTFARSCDEIFQADPTMPSGAYPLASTRVGASSPWQAYCAMVGSGLDVGGWTLVLKASKSTDVLAFGASLWTDSSLLAGTADLAPGDAKLEGFLSLPVHEIRVGFAPTSASPANWVVLALPTSGLPSGLSYPPSSIAQIFSNGSYVATSPAGRAAWLGAVPGAALQHNCNREGLNVKAGALSVRIGILSNEQNDCSTPDSRIGVGGTGSTCGTDGSNRHGDVCACGCYDVTDASVSSADVAAQAFVFVR